jgi:PAS domain S-box-containing protein
MTMLSDYARKIQAFSLKWKLLIPFLFLSFCGTTILTYIGLDSQRELIKQEEKKEVLRLYKLFLRTIEFKKNQALSIAMTVARDPQVQGAMAQFDQETLKIALSSFYAELKERFGIYHFHFHIPPGKSFLRLHMPDISGEMISYRKAIMDTMKTGKGGGGLEWGPGGLGIRGVAPIFFAGGLVGTVELGFPFGQIFLSDLKREWGPDFTVYEKRGDRDYACLATTLPMEQALSPARYIGTASNREPLILIAPAESPKKSILLGPIRDYFGDVVAVVRIDLDRSGIEQRLAEKLRLMVLVGLLGILVSFSLVWIVATLFVRPINAMVALAGEIAMGRRDRRLPEGPPDEMGQLTQSLNTMLDALKGQQEKIEEYARTLEIRVQERTADLVASEEKYRNLVENLPLIVYRVLKDGTTEFVNPYFTETIGYTIEEVVRDKDFWFQRICGHDPGHYDDVLLACWQEGRESRTERVVRDRHGNLLTFMDHAIPFCNEQGEVLWVDGIMVDITEVKRLQDRAVRTEEIRVLGEISSRLAHEIRNPLVTVGGFARRLRDTLPTEDPHRKMAQIIVEEVARLEGILQVILSTVQPFTLCVTEIHPAETLRAVLRDLSLLMEERRVTPEISVPGDLPSIQGDEGLLARAFESLIKHAVISMPEGESLRVSLSEREGYLEVVISHKAEALADEDLDQFFLPRVAGKGGAIVLDLPLSKIIVHRHGGKVDVRRGGGREIRISIQIPTGAQDTAGAGLKNREGSRPRRPLEATRN